MKINNWWWHYCVDMLEIERLAIPCVAVYNFILNNPQVYFALNVRHWFFQKKLLPWIIVIKLQYQCQVIINYFGNIFWSVLKLKLRLHWPSFLCARPFPHWNVNIFKMSVFGQWMRMNCSPYFPHLVQAKTGLNTLDDSSKDRFCPLRSELCWYDKCWSAVNNSSGINIMCYCNRLDEWN